MTTCKMCGATLEGRRRVYCSEACVMAGRLAWGRAYYHANITYAEAKKEQSRKFYRAHPEYQRALRRRKAFARVLGKS